MFFSLLYSYGPWIFASSMIVQVKCLHLAFRICSEKGELCQIFRTQMGWWLPLLVTRHRTHCLLDCGQQEDRQCLPIPCPLWSQVLPGPRSSVLSTDGMQQTCRSSAEQHRLQIIPFFLFKCFRGFSLKWIVCVLFLFWLATCCQL